MTHKKQRAKSAKKPAAKDRLHVVNPSRVLKVFLRGVGFLLLASAVLETIDPTEVLVLQEEGGVPAGLVAFALQGEVMLGIALVWGL